MSGMSMRRAALLQLASKYSGVVVQLALTVVLSRLLTPEEFGLVATVAVFSNFFSVLSDLGISVGIVQYRGLSDDDIAGLLDFSLLLGLALSLLFCAISPAIASLYGASELTGLCAFSSISILFATANAVPNGVLLREKKFKEVSLRYLVVSLVSCVLSCLLALFGAGAYALAANTVLSSIGTFVWNVLATGLRPRKASISAPLRKIGRYSGFQALGTFVNYFSRNMDNLIMGFVFGPVSLGMYDKAYKLTTYPNTYLTGIVSSVLQPFLSEHQDEPDVIWERFIALTKLCFGLGLFIVSVFIAAAPEVIEIMYGPQWSASAPMLRALGLSVAFQMCTSMTGAVFQSLGATDWAFRSTVVNTAVAVFGMVLGAMSGNVLVLCALVSLAYCLNPIATYWCLVRKSFGRPMSDFLRQFGALAIDGVAILLVAAFLALTSVGASLVSLGVKLVVLLGVFFAALRLSGQISILSPILPARMKGL